MKPPFIVTPKSLNLALEIATVLGQLEGLRVQAPQPQLRKQNRIRTIQGSLAIEGNTLSISQVTAVLENKRVAGPAKDVKEVVNAINAYDKLPTFEMGSVKSLLSAHKLIAQGLIEEAGVFRKGGVGIIKGEEISHVAPPANRVAMLMDNLFAFLKKDTETHPLIKSCVFHYELMFIHPFSDGNGRVGRLWQSVILADLHPVFEYLPIESLIKDKQKDYYRVLEVCDAEGESTQFIQFMLAVILESLNELKSEVVVETQTPDSRLTFARGVFSATSFSRKDYMQLHKSIATATASRDLKHGVDGGILRKKGARALTSYQFTDV